MYIGINTERGKRVNDEEAFGYACQRMATQPESEDAKAFLSLIKECDSVTEFVKAYTDWWFSGDWLHKEDEDVQLD